MAPGVADPLLRQGVQGRRNTRKVAQTNGHHDTLRVHSLTRLQCHDVLITLSFEAGDHLVFDVWHELLLYLEAILGECLELNRLVVFEAALLTIFWERLATRGRDSAGEAQRLQAHVL